MPGRRPIRPELPEDLFEPSAWLGSAEVFVDRAVAYHRAERILTEEGFPEGT